MFKKEKIEINPEFIGLFQTELMNIEINREKKKNKLRKKLGEYKEIKITEEENKTLKEIIDYFCDKNK